MDYSHFNELNINAFEMMDALFDLDWTNEKLSVREIIDVTKQIKKIEVKDFIHELERWVNNDLIVLMIQKWFVPTLTKKSDVNKILEMYIDSDFDDDKDDLEFIKRWALKNDPSRLKNFDWYNFFLKKSDWRSIYEEYRADTRFLQSIMRWKPDQWFELYKKECTFELDDNIMLCSDLKQFENFNHYIRDKYLNEYDREWHWVYLFDITILALAYAWEVNNTKWMNYLKKVYKWRNTKKLWFYWLWEDEKIYQVLKAKKLLFDDYQWDTSIFWENVLKIYYKITWSKNLIFRFLVALASKNDDCYALINETLEKIDFKSIDIFETNHNLVSYDHEKNKYERNRSQKLIMEYVKDCDFVKNLSTSKDESVCWFISLYLYVQDIKSLREFFPKYKEKSDNVFMLQLMDDLRNKYWSYNIYSDFYDQIQKQTLSEKETNETRDYFLNKIEELRSSYWEDDYTWFLYSLYRKDLLKFLDFEKEKGKITYILQNIEKSTKKEMKAMKESSTPIVGKRTVIDIFSYLKDWNLSQENWKSLQISWNKKKISVTEYFIRHCRLWYNVSWSNDNYVEVYFKIFDYLEEKWLFWETEILTVKEVFDKLDKYLQEHNSKTKNWNIRLSKDEKIILEKIQDFLKRHNVKNPETKEEFIEKTVKVLQKQFWNDNVFLNKNHNIEITSLDDFDKLKEILSKLEYL